MSIQKFKDFFILPPADERKLFNEGWIRAFVSKSFKSERDEHYIYHLVYNYTLILLLIIMALYWVSFLLKQPIDLGLIKIDLTQDKYIMPFVRSMTKAYTLFVLPTGLLYGVFLAHFNLTNPTYDIFYDSWVRSFRRNKTLEDMQKYKDMMRKGVLAVVIFFTFPWLTPPFFNYLFTEFSFAFFDSRFWLTFVSIFIFVYFTGTSLALIQFFVVYRAIILYIKQVKKEY